MKLHSIHLKNYRCHADLEVHFQSGFNVIVGINGSGKTSLLKGICERLLLVDIGRHSHHKPLETESGYARLAIIKVANRIRFESQYPVTIHSNLEVFDRDIDSILIKNSELDSVTGSGGKFALNAVEVKNVLLPLRAFYRANRIWNQSAPSEMQAATQRNSRLDGDIHWWDASFDATNLQSWVIAKCLERFQTSSETGTLFDSIHDDELALVNAALGEAVENIKGLRYDLKQKSLLVEWQSNTTTVFDNLSDGQRSVICLVADISRRMCLLNPQLGMEVTQQTPGIVLIDELDMHLHPQWQRILTNGLQKAFPKVQFIVASHSPQVLGELKPEQIILLRPEGTAHPQVSYGLTSSQVLEEIMGASERSVKVEERLSELGVALARNELPAARQHISDLEKEAPGIPELTGAKALLKRKEILGR